MARTNLRVLRARHSLTQIEMAEKLGVTRATYQAIESGQRNGSRAFWKALKNEFNIENCEMWDLMLDEE